MTLIVLTEMIVIIRQMMAKTRPRVDIEADCFGHVDNGFEGIRVRIAISASYHLNGAVKTRMRASCRGDAGRRH